MTRAERLAQIRPLLARGMTHREVATHFGVSASCIRNVLYDPDGAKQRARRATYTGSCTDCGATTHSNGTSHPSPRCPECAAPEKYWTRERVVDAIRRFAAAAGRAPAAGEWITADTVRGYPSRVNVYRSKAGSTSPFATWNDAIAAAGFLPNPQNHYNRGGERGLGRCARAGLAILRASERPLPIGVVARAAGCAHKADWSMMQSLIRRGLAVRTSHGHYAAVIQADEQKAA